MAQSSSSSATETLLLPLRVWPEDDANKKSLPSLIQRINEQKGQFRAVTEASLEEEIREQQARDAQRDEDVAEESGDDGDKPENETGRREVLLKAKEEILKQVSQAYMAAYYALDFVSLLLSKDTPRQAELSMSQHLKQHVPMGSLGMEKVQPQPERPQDIKDRGTVQLGWKMQSLQSTADGLLAAAARLETEVQHETQYWEQVLAIDSERWSLCRMPREKHTLGVRFGFLEAAAEFRDRGLGALRRGDGGKTVLDQGLANAIPKVVRVRIEDADRRLTSSSTVPVIANPDTTPIEELILQARNAIYEEELFRELTREARILTNLSVHNIDSVIVLVLPDRRRVLIDLVPLEDYHHHHQHDQQQEQDDQAATPQGPSLAEGIALSLRLLLSHAHRQHFLRRSQIPPPLTDRKRPQPLQAIIRPVLSHLLHRSAITSMDSFLRRLEAALDSAGLSASHVISMGTNCIVSSVNATRSRPRKKQRTAEKVIETFANGVESIVKITLPGGYALDVHLRSQLYPPVLGTDYLVTVRQRVHLPRKPHNGKRSRHEESVITRLHFSSPTEMRRYICHVVTLALIEEIKSWPLPSSSTLSSSSSTTIDAHRSMRPSSTSPAGTGTGTGSGPSQESTKPNAAGREKRTINPSTSGIPTSTTWLSTSSFNELTITYHKVGRSKRLQILVYENHPDDVDCNGGGGGGSGGGSKANNESRGDDEETTPGAARMTTTMTTMTIKWGWLSGANKSGRGSYSWHGKINGTGTGKEKEKENENKEGDGDGHDDDEGPKRSLRAVVAEAAQLYSSS